MKCPHANDWDLLAMEVHEGERAEGMREHARTCPTCGEQLQAARRAHIDRVRMYEAFDRDHDELREQLTAALPEELPRRTGAVRLVRGWARLGDIVMSMNKTTGRRAAAILVPAACVVVIVALSLTVGNKSAFAAAIERMRAAQTIVARFQTFMNDLDEPLVSGKLYISAEHGMRFDAGLRDNKDMQMTAYHRPDGPVVTVQPALNMAIRMKMPDDLSALMDVPEHRSPDAFIRKFMEMTGEADRKLGRSTLDGREVEGFEVSARKLGLPLHGGAASATARLWVDVNTNQPVRLEVEMRHSSTYLGRIHALEVFDQFEWDVPLDAELFVPKIPPGMRTVDLEVPPPSEETLLDALRRCAELTGRYPTELDVTKISRQLLGGLAARGQTKAGAHGSSASIPVELMQDALSASMACCFHEQLSREDRQPEYFGETVTPDDADQVLLRWRLDDGRIRVIYGDLRTETVLPPYR